MVKNNFTPSILNDPAAYFSEAVRSILVMTIDEINQIIGQGISRAIPIENWTKAVLILKLVGEGVVGYSGNYISNNEELSLSIREILRKIRNWIKKLHQITTEGGNNKWTRAVYNFHSNGKFDVDFIWDQELHDEIEKLAS